MEQVHKPIPRLKLNEKVIFKNLVRYLFYSLKTSQHIQDVNQFIDTLMDSWQESYKRCIDSSKKTMSTAYAEKNEETEDVMNILIGSVNCHLDYQVEDFTDEMKNYLKETFKE